MTWLKPPSSADEPFHTRLHKITTKRRLRTCEGGYAVSPHSTGSTRCRIEDVTQAAEDDCKTQGRYNGDRSAYVRSSAGMSGLIGIYGSRHGKVLDPDSNSNLVAPRTLLPSLQGTVEPGTSWYAALVFAVPESAINDTDWEARWEKESSVFISSVHDLLDDLELL